MKVSMTKKSIRTQNIQRGVKPPKPPSVAKKDTATKITSKMKNLSIIKRRKRQSSGKSNSEESSDDSSEESSENDSSEESSENDSSEESSENDSSEESSENDSSEESSENESSEESSENESSEESSDDENCFDCKNKNCNYVFRNITKNTRRKCKKCGRLQLIRVIIKPKSTSVLTKDLKKKPVSKNKPQDDKLYRKRKKVDGGVNEFIEKTNKLTIHESLVKKPLDNSKNANIELKVSEVIAKTKELSIDDRPAKRKKLNNGKRDEWPHHLDEPPIINRNFKIVNNVETKYIVVVPFIFSGKPAHCKHWNDQFNTGKRLNKQTFNKHWDLFSFIFVFVNYNDKTYTSKMDISGKNEVKENDIKVQLTSELTLLLRPTTWKSVSLLEKEMGEKGFKYRIIKNLRFATHYDTQVNLYADKCLFDKNKSWVLHLVLNEQSMSSAKYMSREKIYFNNGNIKNVYTLLNLYQALYLYYSRQINT